MMQKIVSRKSKGIASGTGGSLWFPLQNLLGAFQTAIKNIKIYLKQLNIFYVIAPHSGILMVSTGLWLIEPVILKKLLITTRFTWR